MFIVMATWGRGWEMMMAEAHSRAGTTPLKPFLVSLLGVPQYALAAPRSSCRPIPAACRTHC